MSFNYNTKPIEFIEEVERFSGTKLKRKIDLLSIYEEIQKNNDIKLFEELAFNAKYVMGLIRVVQSSASIPEITNIEQIKKDFSENMEKAVNQVKEIIRNFSNELKLYFEENFFTLSQEGFLNFTELLSDLETVKKYLNDRKRRD